MDTRTLLLGDWTPVIRDGIDVLRLVILGGAVVHAVAGDWGAAALLAFFFGITLVARLLNLPRPYDLSLTVAMALQGFGEVLGLYDEWLAFDDLVHFTLPMLTAPVVYIALARAEVVPDPRDETHLPHYIGIAVVTAALGISIGALWEVYEWRSDAWLGTDLSIDNDDTNGDLVRDSLGSLVGAGLLVVWARFGWGSVRRIPGVNTHEDVSA
ncbi:hypothetical protein E9549_15125 [Blastococcus sp. MG754426]|uniref:hypothetical protein n=1 Tax=unclassified Blastococcus TaxID=2619396 RepID=UPI001EEFE593|nr:MULTISPECIES: hypothetical protein [unclassified Blastococcus]MCF6508727.1 hypothetical protein [Blastococcus sp. MG754426]MCF6513336.1 hypothetical protein [Blastococcus sp. MG754427]